MTSYQKQGVKTDDSQANLSVTPSKWEFALNFEFSLEKLENLSTATFSQLIESG